MTNGGYPDEETSLSVDDDDDVEPDSTGTSEASDGSEPQEQSQAQDEPKRHTYGANSQQLTDSRKDAVESQSQSGSDSSSDSESDSVGLLEGGLTKHELIAFVGGFVASYALAAVFYWGIIISGGFSDVPMAMWVLLGVVVVAPLALMFGLKETSNIAGTILTRGRR